MALVALGAILYCLGEVADKYQSARFDYIFGGRSSYGGYSSYSSSSDYYRYKEEMQMYTAIGGAGALLGLIFGLRGRKRGDGAVATGAIAAALAAGVLTAYTVIEYNLL